MDLQVQVERRLELKGRFQDDCRWDFQVGGNFQDDCKLQLVGCMWIAVQMLYVDFSAYCRLQAKCRLQMVMDCKLLASCRLKADCNANCRLHTG